MILLLSSVSLIPYILSIVFRMRASEGFRHGWQVSNWRKPLRPPMNRPCAWICSFAYCEHVGSCLQYPYEYKCLSGP